MAPRLSPRPSFLLAGHYFTATLVAVGIAVLGLGVFVAQDIRSVNRSTRAMYDSSMSGLGRLKQLRDITQEARRNLLYALTSNESDQRSAYANQSRTADAEVVSTVNQHLERSANAELRAVGQRF